MTRNTILALALGGCTLGLLSSCQPEGKDSGTTQQNAPAIKVFNLRYQEVTDYGEWFGGEEYESFARMNLATGRENIVEACDRLIKALK